MLIPLVDRRPEPAPPATSAAAVDLDTLVRARLRDAAVTVADGYAPVEGDYVRTATGAIANTGSVVLAGEHIDRRALLAAKRVVIRVDPGTVVRYPVDAAAALGDADALILTGASRTADIEKQIVRGIHGAEELIVVFEAGAPAR